MQNKVINRVIKRIIHTDTKHTAIGIVIMGIGVALVFATNLTSIIALGGAVVFTGFFYGMYHTDGF